MKKVLLSSVTALALLSTGLTAAEAKSEAPKAQTVQKASSQSIKNAAVRHARARANAQKADVKIVKEAVEAVALTQQTLLQLSQNKKDEAIKSLEKAIGKLEVVLSHPNAPALLPLDASVVVSEFAGTAYDVENAVITSIALLEKKRVQDARMIVQTLKDEIDLITINMPLASYPATLKLAAKFLHEGKIAQAQQVLATALSTFVEVDVVTPLGIVEAQELIAAASKLAKTDKKTALAYLEAAKAALKKAEALGYTSTSDTTYKMLNEAIEKIEKEIRGKNEATKLFEELIAKLKEFEAKAVKTLRK
jgi:tetratricopeptide (TPR) repeat protein